MLAYGKSFFLALMVFLACASAWASEGGNLLSPPGFRNIAADGWSLAGSRGVLSVDSDCLQVRNPTGEDAFASSPLVIFNQDKARPIEFGYSVVVGKATKADSWQFGVFLTDIEYMDGTTEPWVGLPKQSLEPERWIDRAKTWQPERPVRRLRLRLGCACQGEARCAAPFVRELALPTETTDPEKFVPAELESPLKAINGSVSATPALRPLRDDWRTAYSGSDFVWKIGRLDNACDEFPAIVPSQTGATWSFEFGKGDWVKGFPRMVDAPVPQKHPAKVEIVFDVPASGVYTLLSCFAHAKNLWNEIQLSLDGKPLSRYVVDGNNAGNLQNASHRAADTFELSAGRHVLAYEKTAGAFVSFDALALVKGRKRAAYNCQEFAVQRQAMGKPPLWDESFALRPRALPAAGDGSIGGWDVDIVIEKPDGDYLLDLVFSESFHWETNLGGKAGARVFDVKVNGATVLENYDICRRSNGTRVAVEKIPARAVNGRITLTLVGRGRPARISAVLVNDLSGRQKPERHEFMARDYLPNGWSAFVSASDDPLRRGYFNSPFNLVANPGFEFLDDKAQMLWWRFSGSGVAKQAAAGAPAGQACLELRGGGTLRSDVMGLVVWDTPYSMAFQARASGAAKLRAKLIWARTSVQYTPEQLRKFVYAVEKFQTEYAGCSYGEWVSPGEKWTKLELTATPPRGVDKVGYAVEWDAGDGGAVQLDEFFFDGRGSIPVELIASQGGYDTRGRKTAVVLTTSKCGGGGRYVLRDAGNDIVKVGDLEPGSYPWSLSDGTLISERRWNREVWTLDFSNFTRPGRYTLEVVFKDGQMSRTPIFEIKERLFSWLGKFVATNYFPALRCGVEVLGRHAPCHLDDGDVLVDGKRIHRAIRGGWHDAGDDNIFNFDVINCCQAFQEFLSLGGLEPRIVDELCWGLDYQVITQEPNGRFLERVEKKPCENVAPERETDNDPKTPDNRIIYTDNLYPEAAMLDNAVLINAANMLVKQDAERASRYWRAADRGIEYVVGTGVLGNATLAPPILMAALAQEKSGYKFKTVLDPVREAERIVVALEDGSFLTRWDCHRLTYQEWPLLFVVALADFIKAKPDNPVSGRAERALRSFFDNVLIPLCSNSPFDHAQEYRLTDRFYFTPTGTSYDISYKYHVGHALACGAELFGDERLLRLAEAQVLWGLGLNPTNVSAVAGIGWRQSNAFWVGSNSCRGHENGQYVGGTHHGPLFSVGSLTGNRPRSNLEPPLTGAPFGFFYNGILNDTPSFGPGAEQWIAHAAPLIAACARIEAAHEHMTRK